ncbi:hypothetical protein [Streptomyces sp. NPDC058401]|uniref:hypothetical protein n=1 Tax=Streptomyces sp. NPDC058401 TaxID=3346480 RepID=UPI003655E4A6
MAPADDSTGRPSARRCSISRPFRAATRAFFSQIPTCAPWKAASTGARRCPCSAAHPRAAAAHAPTPLYYVFGDMKILTPVEVLHYTAPALRPHSGAYRLVRTDQAHPFDEVFGYAVGQAA